MRVIDARSGAELTPGQTVQYDGGEWLRLDAVQRIGIARWRAQVTSVDRDWRDPEGPLAPAQQRWVPLIFRLTHPGFFLQPVTFLPT